MRFGLAISALLHALILGFALLQLGSERRELKLVEPEPVAVDIVSEAELTRLKQGNRRAKEPEAVAPKPTVSETLKEAPPKPKVAVVTPPPAPPRPEAKPVDPTPLLEAMKPNEPKPPEAKPPEPVAPPPEPPKETSPPDEILAVLKANEPKPPEKEPEPPKPQPPEPPKVVQKPASPQPPKKPVVPKQPAKPPQVAVATPQPSKTFDVNDPDALNKLLLDKTPGKRPPPPSATQSQTAVTAPPKPTLGAPEGRDQQLSASEIAQLGAIIKRRIREEGCWGIQGGGIDADRISVKLRVRFNQDGSVIGQPQVMNQDASRAFQVAAENAVRAVLACQPYPLPADKFAAWGDMILNFVPRDM